ncbi:hypothetical protein MUK42_27961, partial [Musa troglodytarum]
QKFWLRRCSTIAKSSCESQPYEFLLLLGQKYYLNRKSSWRELGGEQLPEAPHRLDLVGQYIQQRHQLIELQREVLREPHDRSQALHHLLLLPSTGSYPPRPHPVLVLLPWSYIYAPPPRHTPQFFHLPHPSPRLIAAVPRRHLRDVRHEEPFLVVLMEVEWDNELLAIVIVLILLFSSGPHRLKAEDHVVDLEDSGLPFPDHLGLLSPPPVGPTDQLCCGDVEARAIGAGIGNNVGLVSCRRRRVGALERVTHLPPAAVKDEEGARGSGSAGAGAEEEKRLVGPSDAEAVEAGEGGVGAEVGAALPDAVGVGGGGAGEEGEKGALEVEGELEVEVRDAAECREERREAAAELGPGGAAVVAEEQQREAAAPEAKRLLERGPSGGVLEGRVCAGGRKRGDGGSAVEADSEVKRGVAAGNVTAVEYGGDLRSETLLARRVGLGGHLGRKWRKRTTRADLSCVISDRERGGSRTKPAGPDETRHVAVSTRRGTCLPPVALHREGTAGGRLVIAGLRWERVL